MQHSSSSLTEYAETLDILESLYLVDRFNYLNIHIEGDCKSAVDGILSNETKLSALGHFDCQIRSLPSKFYNSIFFVRPSRNPVVYALT